ncbi:MAG: type II secretion system F family protein [Planctomycetaceae bacterium]|nr:type II secretion system F family protein [Planctomycetaceae bacterium]
MNFAYTARRIDGATSAGTLAADSAVEARQLLRRQGLFVLTLSGSGAQSPVTERSAFSATPSLRFSQRITSTEVMLFTSQLAIMSQSKVELADAIENLASTATNPHLRDILLQIHHSLEEGVQLSAALRHFPQVFDEVYISAIRAGEASGRMTDVLRRLSLILRNAERIRSAIRGALAYPAVLLLVSVMVLMAVVFFVLPQFARVFDDVGIVPPLTTRVMLDAGSMIRENLTAAVVVLTIVGIGAAWYFRTESCRILFDRLWLNSPVTRAATRPLMAGRVFRLIAAMLESGIPLLETLRLCSHSVRSPSFQQLMGVLEAEVTLGHMLGPTLAKCGFLPSGAAQMVITAERSGRLAQTFDMMGEYYEEEGERLLKDRVRLLEPTVIVAMGVLVGFVVASVMLPLFDFSAVSKG